MRRQTLLLAASALLGSACSSTIRVTLPVSERKAIELNEVTDDREAEVTLAGDARLRPVPRKAVRIEPVTTRWLEQPSALRGWEPASAPTKDLDTVLVRNRGRGALEGLGFGVLAGAFAGIVLGASANQGADVSAVAFQVIAGGMTVLGGLVGAAFGAAISHRTTIELTPPR